jgi:D-alanine-D-alanine ligase
MRIAIVYNEPVVSAAGEHWLAHDIGTLPPDFEDASELGVLGEVDRIDDALRERGYETTRFAVDSAEGLTRFLAEQRPELIFNSCESFLGRDALAMAVTGVYDLFDIPYTGSPTLALGLTYDKAVAKALFLSRGVPTPPHVLLEPNDTLTAVPLHYPLIVKPAREDASNGITSHSVVHDEAQMKRRVRFVWQTFRQAALVEEFIEGRELNVALLATSADEWSVLPISEIRFIDFGDEPHIVSYESKWIPGSRVYEGTVPQCPADLPEALAQEVRETALRAARLVGLRDYGRIDMRLRTADDAIFVLEANPNPDISHDAGFMRSAGASGRSYADAINDIVERALERSRAGSHPATAQ